MFNNIAVTGVYKTLSYFPPVLLLEANEFTLTEDKGHRKISLHEKVLCIVHSEIQNLEQYIHNMVDY